MMPAAEADSIARTFGDGVRQVFTTGAAAATGLPAMYTPDAQLFDETETTYTGHDAIARGFSQGMPPGATLDIRSTGAVGSGDLVVDMGSYTFSVPNPQGGAPIQMQGRYMVALQRTEDGSWKIVRQIGDAIGIGGAAPTGPPPPAADTANRAR
jgi:ketosteroid isomerase-like protein